MGAEDNKLAIRTAIYNGVLEYKKKLAGQYFLYIFDNRYIEVFFGREHFKHLTGVASYLNGEKFYRKVETNTLTTNQFWFSKDNPYRTAKAKCSRLQEMPKLISEDTLLLEEIITDTCTYSFGTTNLDFTVGFTERTKIEDGWEVIIPHQYVPRTLRVKDEAFDKANNVYEVEYIFSKNNDLKKYDYMTFGKIENIAKLPQDILALLDVEMVKNSNQ